MSNRRIGVAAMGGTANDMVDRIKTLEDMGLPAAWLTTGGAGPDGLTLFAAAAVRTERIMLGTCITPTWPRHPITAVQQLQVIAGLAPGRFRFGVGPSHRPGMEAMFGVDFKSPLTNLREYVHITRTLLTQGSVDFDGRHYHAHATIAEPVKDVPVMASALRRASFEFCGAEADGAISWVCAGNYLRDVAVPAIQAGAKGAGRLVPPLIAHVPVCVHDVAAEVRAAVKEQLANYPRLPFYARMFAEAGYPEAEETHEWSEAMQEGVVLSGSEEVVADRLRQFFDWGAGEVLVSVVTAGPNPGDSWKRTVRLLVEIGKTL